MRIFSESHFAQDSSALATVATYSMAEVRFRWVARFRVARFRAGPDTIRLRYCFSVRVRDGLPELTDILALEYIEEHLMGQLPSNWSLIRSTVRRITDNAAFATMEGAPA